MAARSLPALALAMAALAAVLLPIAIVRRCSDGQVASPPPRPRRSPPQDEATVVAMFGAVCRHEVSCGLGNLERCEYIETTMRKMPKDFALRPCDQLDEAEARRCIAELAARDCNDVATSLDVLALQAVLDRIPSCRLACPTASSP